ncbi:MAG: excinuclease ABC subunit A, partial [Pseudomonadota bacterium]
ARQFLEMMQKPDVDSIEGLSPAISIEQKTTSRNPRSTVGTVTEIYDYMRLLWARVGVPYSPATGLPIESQTISQMVDRILQMGEGAKIYVLAPIVRGRKGEYKKELKDLQAKGFQRVKIDGTLYEIDQSPVLDKKLKHDIEVVVDRLVIRPDLGTRLADSVETALKLADGLLIVEDATSGQQDLYSEKFACPVSGFTIPEIEPRLFSFNSPHGACPNCDGLGERIYFDENLIIPDPSLSIADGAVAPWSKSFAPFYMQALEAVAKYYKFKTNAPWSAMKKEHRDIILFGSGDEVIAINYHTKTDNVWKSNKRFEGVIPSLQRRMLETESTSAREDMSEYQSSAMCESCFGARLKPEALSVKIAKNHISQATEMSIVEARDWFAQIPASLTKQQNDIAARILKEINERLK